MTLFERLQAHRGGLIRIKTQLFWYGGRGWDGNPGRLCLVLDATAYTAGVRAAEAAEAAAIAAAAFTADVVRRAAVCASTLLLVDGAPHWVWVAAEDIELLDGAPQ